MLSTTVIKSKEDNKMIEQQLQQFKDEINAGKVTTYRVAKVTGLSQTHVSRFVKGKTPIENLTVGTADKLLQARYTLMSQK